jgi:hypothetical protein
MVRWAYNSCMAYLHKANIGSIHDNIVTWRKMSKILRNIVIPRTCQLPTYPQLVLLPW